MSLLTPDTGGAAALSSTSWQKYFLAISLFLIGITAANPHLPAIPGNPLLEILFSPPPWATAEHGWRLLEPLNLASENNLAAWWSGICLLAGSLLAYELSGVAPKDSKLPWLTLSIVLLGLSCDEIASLHERIGVRGWGPLGAVLVVALAYSLRKLFVRRATRRAAIFLLLGFFLFSTVVLQEYLEHLIIRPTWMRGLRRALEEGTELAGTFLILGGVIHCRREYVNPRGWRLAIPRPSALQHLPLILLIGLAANTIASIWILPTLPDLRQRGIPANWYPAAVYFLLCSAAVWNALYAPANNRKAWGWLAVALLVSSIDAVTAFPRYMGIVSSELGAPLPEHIFSATGSSRYAVHLAVIALFGSRIPGFGSRKSGFVLSILAVLLVVSVVVDDLALQLTIPGLVTYGVALTFVWNRELTQPFVHREPDPRHADGI